MPPGRATHANHHPHVTNLPCNALCDKAHRLRCLKVSDKSELASVDLTDEALDTIDITFSPTSEHIFLLTSAGNFIVYSSACVFIYSARCVPLVSDGIGSSTSFARPLVCTGFSVLLHESDSKAGLEQREENLSVKILIVYSHGEIILWAWNCGSNLIRTVSRFATDLSLVLAHSWLSNSRLLVILGTPSSSSSSKTATKVGVCALALDPDGDKLRAMHEGIIDRSSATHGKSVSSIVVEIEANIDER